ncbi:ABC transporter ATP-binding protein [Rhizobium sp. SSA_523]|uniref:dipeptide ABC transporter ATP-binding protein n=1 Tax=Rhizobium sp. SSA_523 TaxID=2952477 RepID=UPI0020913A9F|nr:ABC transporter ATP-binding protein [Rhizobium sp. SSA_523]MCO5731180.1 ABC transporter ATP-binding protein [Rhizobium sp. SSA_523]WKC22276.1 ABC transporter ATP-binding protein [Rhizobium sp. SSA_523]
MTMLAPIETRSLSDTAVPVLSVRNYSLGYRTAQGLVPALKDINLTIAKGQTIGLVGESGSGKSSLAWSIMRYLPENAQETGGAIRLCGEELLDHTPRQMADLRGRRMSMVFQDPSTALNPTLRLGEQIAEVLIRHRGLTKQQAWAEAEAALARTGITRPKDMLQRFPHEASGGEKQRVVIATAFACEPELIIFDEPTTALDILTARQILDLFNRLREETEVSALYISHDLGLVARVVDDVSVIHKGVIVETGPVRQVFRKPTDPYTRHLIGAVPNPDRWIGVTPPAEPESLVRLEKISVRYDRPSFLQKFLKRGQEDASALWGARDISFDVRKGELLGIVGESGSGKSTIAKVLAGLQDFEGTLDLGEQQLTGRRQIDKAYRRKVQIVFQHPDASLNPRQKIGTIIARPLKLYGIVEKDRIRQRVAELLEMVRLPADYAGRFPHQLSGGEKQRVAIARAFAAEPSLVICDEVTAALDVSVQAAVAELLVKLQHDTGTACVFITHDLNLIRQLAHRIAVMHHGRLVDFCDRDEARSEARDAYTKALLDAVPIHTSATPE